MNNEKYIQTSQVRKYIREEREESSVQIEVHRVCKEEIVEAQPIKVAEAETLLAPPAPTGQATHPGQSEVVWQPSDLLNLLTLGIVIAMTVYAMVNREMELLKQVLIFLSTFSL